MSPFTRAFICAALLISPASCRTPGLRAESAAAGTHTLDGHFAILKCCPRQRTTPFGKRRRARLRDYFHCDTLIDIRSRAIEMLTADFDRNAVFAPN